MKKIKVFLVILLTFILLSNNLLADVIKPVKWEKSINQISENKYEIIFKAKIDDGWHLYGLNIPEGGPIATSFNFSETENIELIGKIFTSVKPKVKFDNSFEMKLELFDGSVTFTQKINRISKVASISGYIEFMACNNSRCLPPSEIDFNFTLGGSGTKTQKKLPERERERDRDIPAFGTKQIDLELVTNNNIADIESGKQKKEVAENVSDTEEKKQDRSQKNKSLWTIFWEAVSKGIIAIFTPCVFPIIPLTIAFFIRDNSKRKRIFQALFFGFSIVAIYSLVGLIAGLFQIDITALTKHWLANIIIAAILIVFAASFFGMFELVLPGKLSNKLDNRVDKGGLLAPFFLALVTTIVSFSCVGPIAGIAIGAAMTGEIIAPVVAMAGFSSAFALPFVLLGIFPELLKNIPKSGGWLNSVKVFFAFLMLTASYIFLGNTQWEIFNRDIIISFNIVTFLLLGFYLLGKIKFSHDSELLFVNVPRLILVIISFTIAVYMIPGLFGSPLKAMASFLPSQETSEFKLSATSRKENIRSTLSTQVLCDEIPKYSDIFHLPQGLVGYFDYEEGLSCAKEQDKPILLDFVGHSCKNCKKMYAKVWSNPMVLEKLKNNFIIIALYTDNSTKLPENEWVTSSFDGKIKNTIGKKNIDFELSKFKSNALPLYAILDSSGNIITTEEYYTYSTNIEAFLTFLDDGLSNFNK